MRLPDFCLLCFAIGTLWSFVSLLLGGMHVGHAGHAHAGHAPHAGHGHGGHGPAGHHASMHLNRPTGSHQIGGLLSSLVNPSSIAVFIAWFGGIGYLLTRHSGLLLWIDLVIAVAAGLAGAWVVASFLRFLQSREKPLDPLDYEMTGVLGEVSSRIRPDGVGEVIYVRDGVRRAVAARSEDGIAIERGNEVVVARFERGIAYVRTWEAMTQ